MIGVMTHARLAALVGLLCAGCSSGYSSGVDGSKPVSALTMDEARVACESLADYFESSFTADQNVRFQCYVRALSDITSTTAQCEAAFNACLADPPPPTDNSVECDDPMADTTCNATVSQLESCVTAAVETQRDRILEVDCSVAGNVPELMRLQGDTPTPSECTAIVDICPAAGEL